jgi:menaquinone-dependent protoporphyrinogen IX oxidase
MSARVLVAYAASTGFTARHAADVASEIAEVGGLEVDVKPIAYVNSIEPYVAVYLGWSSHSRAGQREMQRFLDRNAPHLADRRSWVVQRQPNGEGPSESGRGPIRLSRLLVRHGVEPAAFAGTGSHRRPEVVPTAPAAVATAVPAPSPAGDDVVSPVSA